MPVICFIGGWRRDQMADFGVRIAGESVGSTASVLLADRASSRNARIGEGHRGRHPAEPSQITRKKLISDPAPGSFGRLYMDTAGP